MDIRGVGVDMMQISTMAGIIEGDNGVFIRHTFTPAEIAGAAARSKKAEYYAARFAAKEAVFKALSPLLAENGFDFRIVETLHRRDGSPYINTEGPLRAILAASGVDMLLLSVSTEGDLAAAFVVACSGGTAIL